MTGMTGWRPGSLARFRSFIRRGLRRAFGPRGEEAVHAVYHVALRRLGRFGPPEDDRTLAVLGSFARHAATIVDVGSNVGRYAWYFARLAPPGAAIFALEPHHVAARLGRLALRPFPRAEVLEIALADEDGVAELVVPGGDHGSPVSGLSWIRRGSHDGEVAVAVRTLDGLVRAGQIALVNPIFVKIDVEGGEVAVLRGAIEVIRAHRPVIYFECQASTLERQGDRPDELWSLLVDAGYRLYANRVGRFARARRVDDDVVNYLAIPIAAWDNNDGDDDGDLDERALAKGVEAWVNRDWAVAGPSALAGQSADAK